MYYTLKYFNRENEIYFFFIDNIIRKSRFPVWHENSTLTFWGDWFIETL